MSKHIRITILSMLALSLNATAGAETAQEKDLITPIQGTCLPSEIDVLMHQVNVQHRKSEELYEKRNKDRKPHIFALQAMQAFRDLGVSLEKTMPASLMPIASSLLKNIHDESAGIFEVYPYKLKGAFQELEQLAILQEKTLDDLASLTPEQQKLAQEAVSLYAIANKNSTSESQKASDSAWRESNKSLALLGEKLTQFDDNGSTILTKTQACILARLADHTFQKSCKDYASYECAQHINTYLAARKAFIQVNLEHKTNQQ